MTAETLTSVQAADNFPVYTPTGAGEVQAAWGEFYIPAVVENGDIFKMCKVPAGAVVLGGMFYGADIDTGTETLDMDIGWAANGGTGTWDTADSDGLGNLGVLTGDAFALGNISPVVGLMYPLSGILATGRLPRFTNETTIQILANAASNAGHVGWVSVVVYYVVQPSLVQTNTAL